MENKRKFKRYVQYLLCDDSAKVKTKICNGNIKIRYPRPKYENVFLKHKNTQNQKRGDLSHESYKIITIIILD